MCRWLVFNKSSVLRKERADTFRPIGRLCTLSFKRARNKEIGGTQVSSGITILHQRMFMYSLKLSFTINVRRSRSH